MGRHWVGDDLTRAKKWNVYDIAVFVALNSRAAGNEDGWNISMKDLAAEAGGMSESSARRAVRRLETGKMIVVADRFEEGGQWRNNYKIGREGKVSQTVKARSQRPGGRSQGPDVSVRGTDVRKTNRSSSVGATFTEEEVDTPAAGAASVSPPDVWPGNPEQPSLPHPTPVLDDEAWAHPNQAYSQNLGGWFEPRSDSHGPYGDNDPF